MKKTLLIIFSGLGICVGASAQVEKIEPAPEVALPALSATQAAKIQNAIVAFAGASRFRDNELRAAIPDQLQSISDTGLNAASADDAAFFLTLFYHKQGYAQAAVKPQIASIDRLVLRIDEGAPTVIDGVRFRGNKSFPEATLKDYLIGPTRQRFSRLKKGIPFVETDLKSGTEQIRSLYESEGFLSASVAPPDFLLSPDKTRASIVVNIEEGPRYFFTGSPEFSGDVVFYPTTQMLVPLAPFLRKPFTRFQLTNMQRALVYFYKQRGYFDPKITVEGDPALAKNGVVPVRFQIEAGGVYRFDGVEKITGLDRLHARFLHQRFGSLSGQFYNPDRLDEIFRDVMKTGLFKTMRVEPQPRSDNTLALHLAVEEARARELGFSLGYGSYEGAVVGVHVAERDVFGTGRPLSANIEWSQRALKGEVVLADPWFLESAYALRVRAYALSEDFDGYSKIESGLRVELSRPITKHLEVTAFFLGRVVNIQNTGIDPDAIGSSAYRASSFGVAETLDFRDSKLNPGRGWIVTSTQDATLPLIGSLDFVRTTGRVSYYLPIKKTLLAFGARAGILLPLAGHEAIPIDERFFNGGARSVRSFAERDLGPKERSGYPVGGESFTQFNLEYVFPIWGDLEGAIFTDAGSIGGTQGFGDLRFGLGGGLRYKLPIGPLRLDYGYNPDRKKDEAAGALHFSFGAAF